MDPSKEPFQSKCIEVRELDISYSVSTSEPRSSKNLVMVHGLGVSSRYMLPTARLLAHHYHTYLPDIPGWGRSEKPPHVLNVADGANILVEWMDAIGLEKAIFLGNSLGCQIIIHLALRYPERVQRVILVSPTMDRHARTLHQIFWRALQAIPFEPLSLYPILLSDYLTMGPRRFLATLRMSMEDPVEKHLAGVQVPALVVHGARDTIVSQRWAEEVARLLPMGQFVTIPEAAHGVNYNSPRELAEVTCTFMDTLLDHQAYRKSADDIYQSPTFSPRKNDKTCQLNSIA